MISKKANTLLAIVILIAVPTVTLFSVAFGMVMENGAMSGCLFDTMGSNCPMNLLAHITTWQTLFATIIASVTVLFAGLLFLFRVAKIAGPSSQCYHQTLYQKQKPDIPLFEYLREAFSRGIIMPKLYEISR